MNDYTFIFKNGEILSVFGNKLEETDKSIKIFADEREVYNGNKNEIAHYSITKLEDNNNA